MKVALVGRPNVGKSTLFNRLIGKKLAITCGIPGTTRDRKIVQTDFCGLKFDLIDTPGIDPFTQNSLAISINEQSFAAVEESNIIFFMVDVVDGLTEYDKEIAGWLRTTFKKIGNRNVVLIKNKAEGKYLSSNFDILGFGNGFFISAEHNLGIEEIVSELMKYDLENVLQESKNAKNQVKIAIVGCPNVGKSTLINAIIGKNRLVTGEEAGITRDSIFINWEFKKRPILLIDTAGQRRRSKIKEKVEEFAVMDAWRYIKQAHVIVTVMDAQNPFEKQDITIARKAFDEGKIVIFAINKSDKVNNPNEILKSIEKRATNEFAQLLGVSCLLVSAKERKGLARIFNVSLKLFDKWNCRISTSALNKWLQTAIVQNPPPLAKGLPVKLKYISQTNNAPPTFTIFANRPEHIPKSYERYLSNRLGKSFNLQGVPLRIVIKR
ncbi:MAG: ribosome biogenesis GTPase Der [Holosporaceae bacterium]|jgi:GTP-binding protein|nr:ribosome biogenesis GTPase Der [Holosporaceae bacterium]